MCEWLSWINSAGFNRFSQENRFSKRFVRDRYRDDVMFKAPRCGRSLIRQFRCLWHFETSLGSLGRETGGAAWLPAELIRLLNEALERECTGSSCCARTMGRWEESALHTCYLRIIGEREYILSRLDCRGMESLKLYLTVDVKHRMLWFEITCDSSRVIIIVSLICHVAPVLTKAAFPFMPTWLILLF